MEVFVTEKSLLSLSLLCYVVLKKHCCLKSQSKRTAIAGCCWSQIARQAHVATTYRMHTMTYQSTSIGRFESRRYFTRIRISNSFWYLALVSVNNLTFENQLWSFRSSRHVGTLGKSFTRSCLWRFGVKLRHSIRAVSAAPLSSSRLEEALYKYLEWMSELWRPMTHRWGCSSRAPGICPSNASIICFVGIWWQMSNFCHSTLKDVKGKPLSSRLHQIDFFMVQHISTSKEHVTDGVAVT